MLPPRRSTRPPAAGRRRGTTARAPPGRPARRRRSPPLPPDGMRYPVPAAGRSAWRRRCAQPGPSRARPPPPPACGRGPRTLPDGWGPVRTVGTRAPPAGAPTGAPTHPLIPPTGRPGAPDSTSPPRGCHRVAAAPAPRRRTPATAPPSGAACGRRRASRGSDLRAGSTGLRTSGAHPGPGRTSSFRRFRGRSHTGVAHARQGRHVAAPRRQIGG